MDDAAVLTLKNLKFLINDKNEEVLYSTCTKREDDQYGTGRDQNESLIESSATIKKTTTNNDNNDNKQQQQQQQQQQQRQQQRPRRTSSNNNNIYTI